MRPSQFAVAALAICAPAFAQATVKTMSSETFAERTAAVMLIDVREPGEWAQTGVPVDAKLISISRSDFIDAVLAETGGDKTSPVAVICKSGSRSVRAAQQLAAAGFTDVTNVTDGMMGRDGVGKGWMGVSLPMKPYTTGGQ